VRRVRPEHADGAAALIDETVFGDMGFLNIFSRPAQLELVRLSAGSFTLDRHGRVITSTLPRSFPQNITREIGQQVLASFRAAERAQMPLSEIIVQYAALKLLARELRGGAIVFLMPQAVNQPVRAVATHA
jgi:hypothetical protein